MFWRVLRRGCRRFIGTVLYLCYVCMCKDPVEDIKATALSQFDRYYVVLFLCIYVVYVCMYVCMYV
jgi:hypothetical protein